MAKKKKEEWVEVDPTENPNKIVVPMNGDSSFRININDKEALDKISDFAGVLDATTVKNKKQLKRSWNNELIVNHNEYNRIMSEGKSNHLIPDVPKGYKSWYDLYLEWDGKTKSLVYNLGNKRNTIDINLLGQYVILEIYERNNKIIKLNEELTAENARLLADNDSNLYKLNIAKYLNEKQEKEEKELSSIKSKWWYKLMTWGW